MSLETAFEVGRLYQPLKAIADTLQSSQDKIFLELPGLIAWFPGGATSDNGHMVNMSLFPTYMEQQGTCPIGYDGHPYRTTGNGINYLKTGGMAPCLGTETWLDASIRGLTIGAWVFLETVPTATSRGLISKETAPPDKGYGLNLLTTAISRMAVSGTGAASVTVDSLVPLSAKWQFVAGRFTPSVEVAIFVDGSKATNTTAVPSSCNASPQDFEVGRFLADDTRIAHARFRDIFVCQSALSDDLIATIMATSAP